MRNCSAPDSLLKNEKGPVYGSQETRIPERSADGGSILHRAHNLTGLVRSVQHGFRLRETIHLLVESRLARVEVVESEVARLVQISLLVLVLLLLVQRRPGLKIGNPDGVAV